MTERPFPHSQVRLLAQTIADDMRTISDQIADTDDSTVRDELLSQLILFQGSLSLITIATIREERFFLQRAIDMSK